jgi:hypothetical protein
MRQGRKTKIDRRNLLRVLGAGAAAAPVALAVEARADSEPTDEKRKSRYNANSDDVKSFYRVNQYPK